MKRISKITLTIGLIILIIFSIQYLFQDTMVYVQTSVVIDLEVRNGPSVVFFENEIVNTDLHIPAYFNVEGFKHLDFHAKASENSSIEELHMSVSNSLYKYIIVEFDTTGQKLFSTTEHLLFKPIFQ